MVAVIAVSVYLYSSLIKRIHSNQMNIYCFHFFRCGNIYFNDGQNHGAIQLTGLVDDGLDYGLMCMLI